MREGPDTLDSTRRTSMRRGLLILAGLLLADTGWAQVGTASENIELVRRYFASAMRLLSGLETAAAATTIASLTLEQREVVIRELTEIANALDKIAAAKDHFGDEIQRYVTWERSPAGKAAAATVAQQKFAAADRAASRLQGELYKVRLVVEASTHLQPENAQALMEMIAQKDTLLQLWEYQPPTGADQLDALATIIEQDRKLLAQARSVSVSLRRAVSTLRNR